MDRSRIFAVATLALLSGRGAKFLQLPLFFFKGHGRDLVAPFDVKIITLHPPTQLSFQARVSTLCEEHGPFHFVDENAVNTATPPLSIVSLFSSEGQV